MNNIFALFFTADFQGEYDPVQLLLGASIGIIAIVILIKKITKRNKK